MKHPLHTGSTILVSLVPMLGSCVSAPRSLATLTPDPSTRIEITQGREPKSGIAWFEARESRAEPVLTSFSLEVFDDVNENGEPDQGETLSTAYVSTPERPSDFIRLRSIDGHWPLRTHRLLALARVKATTSREVQSVTWKVRS